MTWFNRVLKSKDDVESIFKDTSNLFYYLFHKKLTIGLLEINITHDEKEIIYFGLDQHYINKGLGKKMMNIAKDIAFNQYNTHRIWLHTCEFDHERALAFYLMQGFKMYDMNIINEEIPIGYIPQHKLK